MGRALPSHRVDAPVWLTTDISEEAHRVRITVRTRDPRDARAVAMRIINQRRAQNWQVIEVAVLDEGGAPVDLIASTAPHPADSLRGE